MNEIRDIVPPYIQLRLEVAFLFRPYMERAEQAQDSPRLADLEALLHEVLDAIDPISTGGDYPRR